MNLPQNRFWKVISAVTGKNEPATIEEKKALPATPHANQDFDKVMTLGLDKLVEKNVALDDH